jgi:hypothetical protein
MAAERCAYYHFGAQGGQVGRGAEEPIRVSAPMDGGSLAVEIGGDLAPGGSVPLEDRARGGVLAQPVVGAGDEVKERGVAGVGLQVGAAPALAHPGDGCFGIGVDRQGGWQGTHRHC